MYHRSVPPPPYVHRGGAISTAVHRVAVAPPPPPTTPAYNSAQRTGHTSAPGVHVSAGARQQLTPAQVARATARAFQSSSSATAAAAAASAAAAAAARRHPVAAATVPPAAHQHTTSTTPTAGSGTVRGIERVQNATERAILLDAMATVRCFAKRAERLHFALEDCTSYYKLIATGFAGRIGPDEFLTLYVMNETIGWMAVTHAYVEMGTARVVVEVNKEMARDCMPPANTLVQHYATLATPAAIATDSRKRRRTEPPAAATAVVVDHAIPPPPPVRGYTSDRDAAAAAVAAAQPGYGARMAAAVLETLNRDDDADDEDDSAATAC